MTHPLWRAIVLVFFADVALTIVVVAYLAWRDRLQHDLDKARERRQS